MKTKRSIADACMRAAKLSAEYPDYTYYVMDKPRQKAVVHSVDWAVRQRIREGWYIVAKYENGKEVK